MFRLYLALVYNVALHGTCFYPHHSHHCTYRQRSWNRWTHLDEARNFSSLQGFWALCFPAFWKRHQNYWLCLFFWVAQTCKTDCHGLLHVLSHKYVWAWLFEVQSTSVHTKGRNKRGGPWILLSWWPFFLLKRWEAMPMPCPVERTRKGLKVPIQQRCIVVWYQLDLPSSSGRWSFTFRDSLLNM